MKQPILIYDGHCPFCRKQVENLRKLVGDRFDALSFQEQETLNKFPQLDKEECLKEIKLILRDDALLGGAHAIFYTMSLNPWWRWLRYIYPIPVIKQCFDFGYRMIAKNRYRIQKKDCPDGTCHMKY